jgi:hypothetical protein
MKKQRAMPENLIRVYDPRMLIPKDRRHTLDAAHVVCAEATEKQSQRFETRNRG